MLNTKNRENKKKTYLQIRKKSYKIIIKDEDKMINKIAKKQKSNNTIIEIFKNNKYKKS